MLPRWRWMMPRLTRFKYLGELDREVCEPRKAHEILKQSSALFAQAELGAALLQDVGRRFEPVTTPHRERRPATSGFFFVSAP